jgi:hypothetical protein
VDVLCDSTGMIFQPMMFLLHMGGANALLAEHQDFSSPGLAEPIFCCCTLC